jgi:hypothetical protein
LCVGGIAANTQSLFLNAATVIPTEREEANTLLQLVSFRPKEGSSSKSYLIFVTVEETVFGEMEIGIGQYFDPSVEFQ